MRHEEDLAMARALLKDPAVPVAQVAKCLAVSRATFYTCFSQRAVESRGNSSIQLLTEKLKS